MPDQVFTPDEDGLAAYHAAVERVKMLNESWEELGFPITSMGSRGQEVAHPLPKMIQDAEALALRLRGDLRKKHRGPQPGAVPTLASRRITRRKAS